MHKIIGFSLLELMITVGIISILTFFGFPIYTQYVAHAKRLEAEVVLTKLASEMEHYYLKNNTYKNATLEKLKVAGKTSNDYYQIIIESATRSNFIISARPLKIKDPLCGTLRLNALGEQSESGVGRKDDCW